MTLCMQQQVDQRKLKKKKKGWSTKIFAFIGSDIYIYLIYILGWTEIQAVKKFLEIGSTMIHAQLLSTQDMQRAKYSDQGVSQPEIIHIVPSNVHNNRQLDDAICEKFNVLIMGIFMKHSVTQGHPCRSVNGWAGTWISNYRVIWWRWTCIIEVRCVIVRSWGKCWSSEIISRWETGNRKCGL